MEIKCQFEAPVDISPLEEVIAGAGFENWRASYST